MVKHRNSLVLYISNSFPVYSTCFSILTSQKFLILSGKSGDPHPATPISPLAVTFKRANSHPSIPQAFIEEPTNSHSVLPSTLSHRRRDSFKLALDSDCWMHDIEPSIFSTPSLNSLNFAVSIREEVSKQQVGVGCVRMLHKDLFGVTKNYHQCM